MSGNGTRRTARASRAGDKLLKRAAERVPLEDAALSAAADERWDLQSLDRRVRESQQRRRLVADALRTGRVTAWDLPGGYISTGDDFWTTTERARRA